MDVELQTASKIKASQLQKLRAKASIVLSFHDFRGTKKLEETLEKMLAYPADYYKVVSTATTLSDNVTMIKFLAREGDRHSLVGMCMGEQGIISRVLGVRAGSVIHLRFRRCRAGNGPGTDHRSRTAQRLPDRSSGRGYARLWGRRRPVAHSLPQPS